MAIHIGDKISSKDFGYWRDFYLIPSSMPLDDMAFKIKELHSQDDPLEITFAKYFDKEYALAKLLNTIGCQAEVSNCANIISIK